MNVPRGVGKLSQNILTHAYNNHGIERGSSMASKYNWYIQNPCGIHKYLRNSTPQSNILSFESGTAGYPCIYFDEYLGIMLFLKV